MKKMTPGDIEDWREDCRTGRTIMIPSSEFRVFLDAWEEREALKKALRRLQLDGQRVILCHDCAREDTALMSAFCAADFGVLGGQGADSTCDLCGEQKGGREVVVPGKLAAALEWNEKLRAQPDVAAIGAVLAAADAVCNEAMQMTVSVPEKMSGQVARVRFVVEQFRSVCSSHMRSLAGAGEGEKS